MHNGVFSIPLAGQPVRLGEVLSTDFLRPCDDPHVAGDDPRTASHSGRDEIDSPEAQLEEFIAGRENQALLGALRGLVCERPGRARLVVLYGPSGVGKSHLAHGALAYFRAHTGGQTPRPRSVLVRCADFGREFGEAVATRSVSAWRKRYFSAVFSVFEDLGQLDGKPAAQEELCGILDHLLARERRVLVTAAGLPAAAGELSPRLRSRLSAGLNLAVAPPGEQTRRELLARLAQRRRLTITDQAAARLVAGPWRTFHDLRGAILTLEVLAAGRTIDEPAVSALLAKALPADEDSLAEIGRLTARQFGLPLAALRGNSRRRGTALARQVAMLVARDVRHHTLSAIGRYFGGRDHSTVLHSCRRAAASTDPVARRALAQIRAALSPMGP